MVIYRGLSTYVRGQTPDLRPISLAFTVSRPAFCGHHVQHSAATASDLRPPTPDLVPPSILHYQFVDILTFGPAFCFQHGARVKLFNWAKAQHGNGAAAFGHVE